MNLSALLRQQLSVGDLRWAFTSLTYVAAVLTLMCVVDKFGSIQMAKYLCQTMPMTST